MNKYLIIRFSSFGDIVQALPAADAIRRHDPQSLIHWLTRQDFRSVVATSPALNQILTLDKAEGLVGLWTMIRRLQAEKYTHIYDAHNNLRSNVICFFLSAFLGGHSLVRRSKNRWKRFLLFNLRINLFPKPFRGTISYLEPLLQWWPQATVAEPDPVHLNIQTQDLEWPVGFPMSKAVVLAPGGAWELKRWPLENWIHLTELKPDLHFVLIGGREDQFIPMIVSKSHNKNILNLASQLSWEQTMKVIQNARALVSGDTGALHVADVLGKPCIGLIGPTAFGYPAQASSEVIEVELKCKPCSKDGRGHCKNIEYKKCMIDIRPHMVAEKLSQILTNH